MSTCPLCNKVFKQYQGRNRLRCNSCNTKIRRIRNSLAAIEYLGGECVKCGEKHPSVLEFHHKDPTKKNFQIGNAANKSWNVLVTELDKCELLCSNCHRKEHTDRYSALYINEAMKYNGTEAIHKNIDWAKIAQLVEQ